VATVISTIVVVAVLAFVFYVAFELTPFATHGDTYRDRVSGKRRFESPHLETRDEFEHRTGAEAPS